MTAAVGIMAAAMAWPYGLFERITEEATLMLKNSGGPLVVTIISFGFVGWALFWVFRDLGVAPTISNGTITSNPLQGAKDILTAVIPFASAAVGFWFGSDGKTQAQNQAQQAQEQANAERDRATKADQQKGAMLQSADNAQELLDKAKALAPEAFN
jgi:CBS domain containing-hemolysin-like protein